MEWILLLKIRILIFLYIKKLPIIKSIAYIILNFHAFISLFYPLFQAKPEFSERTL